jgi:(1->4)-alpha-D-glucan 1-alpha-D-glucosylmutase
LPVYRTYIDARGEISGTDRRYLETALSRARRSQRATDEALGVLGQVLLLRGQAGLHANEQQERLHFIQRFQQLTGPAAAKGVEDTALYAYVPLASRNEVGGAPDSPIEDAAANLHRENQYRAATFPDTMLCVTTHDTKRSADVRSRLDVLSEVPKLWNGYVTRWQRLNRPHRTRVSGRMAPEPATQYLFYQSLVGLWPAPDPRRVDEQFPDGDTLADLRGRLERYMLKAAREAKTRTSWVKTNTAYEDALVAFVRSALLTTEASASPFLNEVHGLVARIARPGFWNAVSRTLIQFTSPGTPDLYQGDELWNLALVDPDNRRPVDYEIRQRALDEIVLALERPDAESRAGHFRDLVQSPEDGRIKLHVIRGALYARRKYPHLFACGDYLPLDAEGPCKEHVFAFARSTARDSLLVLVPRFTTALVADASIAPIGAQAWPDTVVLLPERLRDASWNSPLTGDSVPTIPSATSPSIRVADALRALPVGLFVSTNVADRKTQQPDPG